MNTNEHASIAAQLFSHISVMVVDDDDFTRHLLVSLLKKMGIGNVWGAASAVSAFNMLSNTSFDLVFCDLEMPLIDGVGFIKQLRSGRGSNGAAASGGIDPHTPVVILTKHASEKVVKLTHAAGANGFLVKPVSPKQLEQRIVALVKPPGRG